jgi:hypothetical protein
VVVVAQAEVLRVIQGLRVEVNIRECRDLRSLLVLRSRRCR